MNVIFSCDKTNLPIPAADIIKILPNWKTRITYVGGDAENLKINFVISAKTEEEIKDWLKEFQDKTFYTYSIKSTDRVTGKYVIFKQRLHCQHNTKSKRLYNPSVKSKTKNTNCPSTIIITLRSVKKRGYRGKDKSLAPDPELPCLIKLQASHNHASDDTLKFRKVSEETKQKLLGLFKKGHTPTSALTNLRLNICINFPDCAEKLLADRKYSADYSYCHNLYKHFIEENGPIDYEKNSNEFIIKWIEDFNQSAKEKCIEAFFSESQYVICICTPLMRRIHKIAKASSEIVFIDSTSTVDRKGIHVFLLLTYSECGALPLAIIITSSEEAAILIKGFQILKEILGDDIFGWNVNGPRIFLINNSSEQAAIQSIWTNSECFLCVYHILQSMWRWLINSEHCINVEDLQKLFTNFKEIVYAKSPQECENKYEVALSDARMYPNYIEYLDNHWQQKELWALIYRTNKLTRESNIFEVTMYLLKDKIFEQIKTNNITHLIDFLSTEFINYFEMRILDAAHNRSPNNFFNQLVKIPPLGVTQNIEILPGNIYLVPRENKNDLFYIVNSEVLICTCRESNTGRLCKHLHAVCFLIYSEGCNKPIDNIYARKELYLIAKGEEAPQDWLSPIFNTSTENITNSSYEKVRETEENYTTFEETDNIFENNYNEYSGEIITENNNLIRSIMTNLQKFAMQSPLEMNIGLKQMLKNLLSLKTSSACASACASFGKSLQQKKKQNNKSAESISIQPSASSKSIRCSSNHVRKRPYKRKIDDD